ncbi:MAG TPA: zinc-binding alcohol dehydrogenase family protein [Roseiarcus sp.]|nr:zinc-binding alcohol dehydrogenase family protein [Roseiarcus sp.]
MKAAIVLGASKPPIYGDFEEPIPSGGERLVAVVASALSPLTRSRASGAHYSSSGRFPFVAGVDGVGRLDDGRRVYFFLPRDPFGGMAEEAVAPSAQCVGVPDGLDDVAAAAIANPGMSSWVAFKQRAELKAGETVLINGATGTAGRLAIQIAKHLGAKRIVATGRNVETLRSLEALGADATIPLVENQEALESAFEGQFASGVDVVIDYLWGESAERLLRAAAKAGDESTNLRFVQVGSASGSNIALSSAILRSRSIVLMGSGLGSVPNDRLVAGIGELMRAAVAGGFRIATKAAPLAEVEREWSRDAGAARVVFTVG